MLILGYSKVFLFYKNKSSYSKNKWNIIQWYLKLQMPHEQRNRPSFYIAATCRYRLQEWGSHTFSRSCYTSMTLSLNCKQSIISLWMGLSWRQDLIYSQCKQETAEDFLCLFVFTGEFGASALVSELNMFTLAARRVMDICPAEPSHSVYRDITVTSDTE